MPVYKISEEVVNRITSEYPEISSLSLANNEIQRIENLHTLTSLRTIDLAYNKIQVLDFQAFAALHSLQELYLQYNQISEVRGCQVFFARSSLAKLDLSFNPIKSLDVVADLAQLRSLTKLFLTGSPLSLADEYRTTLVQRFPQLVTLDGVSIARIPAPQADAPAICLEDQWVQTQAASVMDAHMQTAAATPPESKSTATQIQQAAVRRVTEVDLLAGRARIAIKAREAELSQREEAVEAKSEELKRSAAAQNALLLSNESASLSTASQTDSTAMPTEAITVETRSIHTAAENSMREDSTQTRRTVMKQMGTQTSSQEADGLGTFEKTVQTTSVNFRSCEEVANWKREALEARQALARARSQPSHTQETAIQTASDRTGATKGTQTVAPRANAEARATQTTKEFGIEAKELKQLLESHKRFTQELKERLSESEEQRSALMVDKAALEQSLAEQKQRVKSTQDELLNAQSRLQSVQEKCRAQAESLKETLTAKETGPSRADSRRMAALEELLRAQDRIFEMDAGEESSKSCRAMKMWRDKVFAMLVQEKSSQLRNAESAARLSLRLQEAEEKLQELMKEKLELLDEHADSKEALHAARTELLKERSALLAAREKLHRLGDVVATSLKSVRQATQEEEARIFRKISDASTRLHIVQRQTKTLQTVFPVTLEALGNSQAKVKSLESALEVSMDELRLSRELCDRREKEIRQQRASLTESTVELDILKRRTRERELEFSQEVETKLLSLEGKMKEEADRLRAEKEEEKTLRLRFENEIRQVRRQLARQHEKYEQSENSKNLFMVEKLKRKDHEISCLRRERNVLLSALRGRNKSAESITSPRSSSQGETQTSEVSVAFSSPTSPQQESQGFGHSDGSVSANSPRQHSDSVDSMERLAGLAAKVLSEDETDTD